MVRVYLGLGGNIGDTRDYFRRAIEKLGAYGTVVSVSSLYETEPWGITDQPLFLNAALALDTALAPEELLAAVKRIEQELGRTPAERNGPREIDIDILLYGDTVFETDALTIPHAGLPGRASALVPLAEIAPDVAHPTLQKTIAALANDVAKGGGFQKLPAENSE
jgi:2-amino-4-hydroxy-6-hydroxymethyldihydropteridine diphosphokinase